MTPPKLVDTKLHAGPANALWPSRVCLDHDALVFESACGCNDALLCDLRVTTPTTLDVHLRTDPTRMKTCDDCFPMVPARCPLTQLPRGAWTLTINGAPALDFTTGADRCWTE